MPAVSLDPAFQVLLVCTGNICRSAFAERLGRAWLDETLGAQASRVQLSSAGTRAVVGRGLHPDTALVLAGYGADGGDFRARQLTFDDLEKADLVLTMTRTHRRDVLALAPRGLARTFTLREARALLDYIDGASERGDEDPAATAMGLVAALTEARSRRQEAGDDDVPDPINLPLESHAQTGQLIVDALLPVLRRLIGTS